MSSRFLSVAGRISAPKILSKQVPAYQPNFNLIHKSLYHTSIVVLRKSGSSALEPKTRLPSTKQIKRKMRASIKTEATADRKKEKLKLKHMKQQFESGEVREFIEKVRGKLAQPVMNMLLPEGLQNVLAPLEDEDELALESQVDPYAVLAQFEAMKMLADGKSQPLNDTFTKALAMNKDDQETVGLGNLSIVELVAEGEEDEKYHVDAALQLYDLMQELQVPVQQEALNHLVKAAVRVGALEKAEEIFNSVASSDTLDLSVEMWAAKAEILCKKKDIPGAVALLDKLIKLSIRPDAAMYSTILGAYVRTKDLEKAYKMWIRMHKEAVAINHDGFNHMFRMCFAKGESERSFFYLDEMRVFGLEPTLETFKNFFMAASTAPHYVPGYQDTLSDAMAMMEGKEMIPDAGVYESLIYAFGRARDPVAAEYYFWEMVRKGIDATPAAYENLFNAYKLAQSVGAKRYGTLGRYSRPAPKKLSPVDQALVDIGPVRAAELMTSGVYTDYTYEKGERRTKKPVIEDMLDDSEGDETFRQQVFAEAAMVRKRKGLPPPQTTTDADLAYTARLTAGSEEALQLGRGGNDSDTLELAAGGEHKNEDDNDLEENWDVEGLEERFKKSLSFSREEDVDEEGEQDYSEEEGEGEYEYSRNSDDYYEENGRKEVDLQRANLNSLAEGDLAFEELLTQIRDSNDGSFDGMELDGKPIKTKKSKRASVEETSPKENLTEKEEFARALLKINDLQNSQTFEDPFAEISTNRGIGRWAEDSDENLAEQAREEADQRKLDMVSLLDNDVSAYERIEQGARAALAGDSTRRPSAQSTINALARSGDASGLPAASVRDVQDGYDLVFFGRPPNADYSAPLETRRRINVHRAELAFQHMLESGIKPTNKALTNLFGVYSEAGWADKAEKALELFPKHKQKPTNLVYENLMQAYVRRKDLDKAHKVLVTMRENKLVPTGITYGRLVQACIQRNLVVEALKVVEEASASNVALPEHHIRHLRSRCKSLGIKHPDIPADPLQWVKDVKLVRRQQKNASQRFIEPIRNVRF